MLKKMLNMLALSSVLGLALVTTGCGDDDDNGGNNNPPVITAPASVNGQEITVTRTGGNPERFAFAAQGNNIVIYTPGTTNALFTGTFEYSAANNTATLTLRDVNGSNPTTYNLVFTSATAGTFSYTDSNGQAVTGTFSGLQADTTPDPTDPTDPTDPGETNMPPVTVSGKTLTINATTGPLQGTTTYNFTGATFTSGNSGSGNFTYTLTGTTANLVLDYTAPADFNGDRDTVIMSFNANSGTQGTFTGNTKIDETTSDWSGTFQLSQ